MTQDLERLAEDWVFKNICYGGLEYALSGKTAENCVASYKAGYLAAEGRAKVAEVEAMMDHDEIRESRDRARSWARAWKRAAKNHSGVVDSQVRINQSLRYELKEVTKAGTPYWRERDTMNALVLDNAHLRAVLELIAAPKRADGTYNRCREACEEIAKAALAKEKGE